MLTDHPIHSDIYISYVYGPLGIMKGYRGARSPLSTFAMSCRNCLEHDRLWTVSAYRGMAQPRRVFGRDMSKEAALARALLVQRLFPGMADPQVTPSVG